MCRLNPRVDFAFKKLFGSEENKDLLISFINAIVSCEDQVTSIELKNPYNNKLFSSDKFSILDIKAQDSKGKFYHIEIQITDQVYYEKRALYYWAKLYTSQLEQAGKYESLTKTIAIHVLNFNCMDHSSEYHNTYKLINTHLMSNATAFKDIELHFIELEKFDIDLSFIKTVLERWVTFLKKAEYYDSENLPKELASDPCIKKAFTVLDTINLDKDEREVYDAI